MCIFIRSFFLQTARFVYACDTDLCPRLPSFIFWKVIAEKTLTIFFRTDRTALKRNFLHLNGKLCAALLRGLFCLNEKAEEAVAPPAEIYLNYHLCRIRIFPLPRIKRILFRPVFLFYPRRAFSPRRRRNYPNRVFSFVSMGGSFRFTRSFITFSFAEILPRFLIRDARSFAFAAFFSRDAAHAQ